MGFGKGKGKGKRDDKVQFDKAKTVWLGSLPDGVTDSDLMELGTQAGKCKQALVVKQGQAMLEYTSQDEVASAVQLLNGATVGEIMIQADFWQKPMKALPHRNIGILQR